jgi:hypothetical protein
MSLYIDDPPLCALTCRHFPDPSGRRVDPTQVAGISGGEFGWIAFGFEIPRRTFLVLQHRHHENAARLRWINAARVSRIFFCWKAVTEMLAAHNQARGDNHEAGYD